MQTNRLLALEIIGTKRSSLFAKMRDVYPECEHLIHDLQQMHPLKCLVTSCPRNMQCMEKLAKRVKYMFDTFERADLLVLYFSYRDRPGSQRAGIFHRDMREPKYITLNRSTWEKCKTIGRVFEYHLPNDLFLQPAQPQGR